MTDSPVLQAEIQKRRKGNPAYELLNDEEIIKEILEEADRGGKRPLEISDDNEQGEQMKMFAGNDENDEDEMENEINTWLTKNKKIKITRVLQSSCQSGYRTAGGRVEELTRLTIFFVNKER